MFTQDAIILVDADSLFFRICCVTKKKNEIRKGIKHSIDQLRRNCLSDNIMHAVKGRDNFRNLLVPDYKANRKPMEQDLKDALNYAHNYMVNDIGAIAADGMEADDLCAIWATEARDMGREFVVAGIDKDLLQIPGDHYNYQKGTHQTITEDEGNLKLMLQCLTGDNADNIKGLKGIGPKKAEKILAGIPMQRRWNRVRAAWRGHGAGDPTTSWRLLKMLETWEEYEEVMDGITSKSETTLRQQNVLHEGTEEDGGIYSVPTGDSRRTPRDDRSVAVRK